MSIYKKTVFLLWGVFFLFLILFPIQLTTTNNSYTRYTKNETSINIQISKVSAQTLRERIAPPIDSTDPVIKAWSFMRSLVNSALVIILILAAFANILNLNIDTYTIKKVLPAMIIGVILANFSLFICRMFIDLANVLTYTFIDASAGSGAAETIARNILSAMGFGSGYSITTGSIIAVVVAVAAWAITPFALLFALLFFIGVPVLVFLALLLLLAGRTGLLYFLVIISPVAFFAMAFPFTEQWFKKWWNLWMMWVFMLPIIFVILKIAAVIGASVGGETSFFTWVIANVLVVFAVIAPFTMGGVIGNWVKGAAMGLGVGAGLGWMGKKFGMEATHQASKTMGKQNAIGDIQDKIKSAMNSGMTKKEAIENLDDGEKAAYSNKNRFLASMGAGALLAGVSRRSRRSAARYEGVEAYSKKLADEETAEEALNRIARHQRAQKLGKINEHLKKSDTTLESEGLDRADLLAQQKRIQEMGYESMNTAQLGMDMRTYLKWAFEQVETTDVDDNIKLMENLTDNDRQAVLSGNVEQMSDKTRKKWTVAQLRARKDANSRPLTGASLDFIETQKAQGLMDNAFEEIDTFSSSPGATSSATRNSDWDSFEEALKNGGATHQDYQLFVNALKDKINLSAGGTNIGKLDQVKLTKANEELQKVMQRIMSNYSSGGNTGGPGIDPDDNFDPTYGGGGGGRSPGGGGGGRSPGGGGGGRSPVVPQTPSASNRLEGTVATDDIIYDVSPAHIRYKTPDGSSPTPEGLADVANDLREVAKRHAKEIKKMVEEHNLEIDTSQVVDWKQHIEKINETDMSNEDKETLGRHVRNQASATFGWKKSVEKAVGRMGTDSTEVTKDVVSNVKNASNIGEAETMINDYYKSRENQLKDVLDKINTGQ